MYWKRVVFDEFHEVLRTTTGVPSCHSPATELEQDCEKSFPSMALDLDHPINSC